MKLTTTIAMTLMGFTALSQLSATGSSQLNTNCNGTDCNYSGPSILINELMISPIDNDGSISGNGGVSSGRGEWIELYNPNLCEPVDISCYYLGNDTPEGNGGFVIPAGTIVPPAGFCMIRGMNVPAVPANLLVQNGGNVVEVVVPYNISDPGVCAAGSRLWFPNAGGWFAFYDSNGVPQDAVSWVNSANVSGSPCIPSLPGCSNATSLPSYNNIPAGRKNYLNTSSSLILGSSVRRLPDGGAWDTQAAPTYATCNGTCIPAGSSSCTGTATINVSGGTPPYTYAWNDSQAQTTQTALNLCAGTYTVTVTDNDGTTGTFQVTVSNFVPTVSVDLPAEICVNANPVPITVSPVATTGQTGTLTGNGVSSSNFNPTSAGVGNHTVTYFFQDQFGCSNSASDSIIVHPLPVVSITNNQSPYCLSTTLAGLLLSPAGGQLSGTGVVNNQFIPSQAGVGTFTLTYTYQDANGCSNSTTITVQVVGSAPATLTIPSDLCIDSDPVIMVANPGGGNFQVDGTASGSTFNSGNEGIGSHVITYSLTDANGCLTTASGTIQVHGLPDLQIPLNGIYCYETGVYPVSPTPPGGTFTGANVLGNGINIQGVSPGSYTVSYTYTDSFGCSNQLDKTYTVSSPVPAKYTYETNCFQEATFTSLVSNPDYTYHWNIGNSYQGSGNAFAVVFTSPGTYPVVFTVTDQFGCSYDSTGVVTIAEGVKIEELGMPNIITPNGDGVNDRLEMPALLTDCFEYEITIVNRWGNVVYSMDNNSSFFEGRDKHGNELSEGVYFYSIKSDDFDCNDKKYKGFCYGNITIVR
ncbi:gliding motility-associated C-terminal domain-containing protein [Fluviicola sp.]|uniref:T9SS type B sorting domain-containing protein n=1 Tax=Fluviicola sp. TaxID=1917219 RepID=UPI0031E2760A